MKMKKYEDIRQRMKTRKDEEIIQTKTKKTKPSQEYWR